MRFFVLLVWITLTSSDDDLETKIFAGDYATPGQFPFMVSIRDTIYGRNFCGGSILSPTWVLTAAHCLEPLIPQIVVIVVGTTAVSPDDPQVPVLEFVLHPDYEDKVTVINADLALMRVAPLVFGPGVQPIEVGPFVASARLVALGWGLTQSSTNRFSPWLMYVEMRAVTSACRSDGTKFCAAAVDGSAKATTCTGDSGGPVVDVDSGRLVGVTSYGWVTCDDKAKKLKPDRYMRVDAYEEWIEGYVTDGR